MLDLKDRATALTESAKQRLAERHAEALERENDRLKVENSSLREQTDQDRDRIDRILDSLDDVTTAPKRHRLRRLMTLSIAAGGAYVMGAKAGRERYEQIRNWWADRRTQGIDRMNEWGEDVTSRAGGAMQGVTQKAAGTVEETGTKAAKAVEDAGTQHI
jgi:hypothetical protein